VLSYVRALEEEYAGRAELNLRNAWLYGSCDLRALVGSRSAASVDDRHSAGENYVKSVIDTAASMIAKNRPKATFVTDGADFSTQRRARQLDRFVEAMFQKHDVYQKAVAVFVDACVFGTGVMKIVPSDGEVCVERILPDEILVDEVECRTSSPRQIHQRKLVDRDVLKGMFPDHADEIDGAKVGDDGRHHASHIRLESTQLAVVESYRLPSVAGAGDGIHSIVADGVTLLWEEWSDDCFPFVFYRWTNRLAGFWGDGLCFELAKLQYRLDKLNERIETGQDLICVPRVWVDIGSKVQRQQINNEIAGVFQYRGKPPLFQTAQAFGPEVYQERERIIQKMFSIAGISQMSAQSQKPAGLESAVALREFNDIETQRFAIQAQAYESMFLDIARHIVGVCKELNRGKKPARVAYKTRDIVKMIDWSEVDMDEDQYAMGVEASSLLSRTPAGRTQQVIEWTQANLISGDEARRLLGHPDLERTQSLHNAAIEDIEAVIEHLLDEVPEVPEPYQNLTLGIERVQMALLKARRDGAPENILESMRTWIDQASHILTPPQPAGMPAAPPVDGAAPPDAMGMAVSNALPPESVGAAAPMPAMPGTA
jgi:hypothetical protein